MGQCTNLDADVTIGYCYGDYTVHVTTSFTSLYIGTIFFSLTLSTIGSRLSITSISLLNIFVS